MTIFALNIPDPKEEFRVAMDGQFRGRFLQVTPTQFLVSADRITAAEILDRLGAADGKLGRVLVLRVADYFGWHSKEIWEWIGAQNSAGPPSAGEQANV